MQVALGPRLSPLIARLSLSLSLDLPVLHSDICKLNASSQASGLWNWIFWVVQQTLFRSHVVLNIEQSIWNENSRTDTRQTLGIRGD